LAGSIADGSSQRSAAGRNISPDAELQPDLQKLHASQVEKLRKTTQRRSALRMILGETLLLVT
jgi:hypothetical protein